jgi:diguanylate cyclase (GGDEF)-like protein
MLNTFWKLPSWFSNLRKGNPVLSLTNAYIIALLIIATLTIFSHFIVSNITKRQIESAELSYFIGRQRALLQQTIIYASNYYNSDAELEREFLKNSISALDHGHHLLKTRVARKDFLGRADSKVLFQAYYGDGQYSIKDMEKFISAAREFEIIGVEEGKPARKRALDASSAIAGSLTRTLDILLEDYQTETIIKIKKSYDHQLWTVFVILLVLLIEAVYIFNPLIKRIQDYHQILLREALEDHLTGLYNRRAFLKRAAGELSKARRDKNPVAVILTDLDHFKKVNDTYGHNVGDLVLKRFSALAQKSFRPGDIVGRIGGEEFAILLPNIKLEQGQQIIERFRALVSDTPCHYKDDKGEEKSLNFSASFGMVVVAGGSWTIDQLLAAADERLYAAKHAGRNRVVAELLLPGAEADADSSALSA